MKVKVEYVDEYGVVYWKEEYNIDEVWKVGLGNVVEDMMNSGVKVRQVENKIIEILED